jgi:6-phosphofructokinase 1
LSGLSEFAGGGPVPPLPAAADLTIRTLGPCTVAAPFRGPDQGFVTDDDRILASADAASVARCQAAGLPLPSFEAAGPRARIFFQPDDVSCGIVTCGGLCPGLNDVIRSIVLTLNHGYDVERILGFRYGYAGLSSRSFQEPMMLDPDIVGTIHKHGGTLLGTSRGPQDLGDMVDALVSWRIRILFCVGGDGTLRGASALAGEIARRNLKIAVIGIPKTIDNDLEWIERSFGFSTAVGEARQTIDAAHAEAQAAWNGVGLVKLMGRQSGFIAAHATLASGDVNYCLVPEVAFTLESGFLPVLRERLARRRHAVVVVAEGAGQELIREHHRMGRDASGNIELKEIGPFLRDRITSYMAQRDVPVTVKYIDPSYTIRSLPASSTDSSFCLILGQHAVHAGMAGRTDVLVGYWNGRFTHVPIGLATSQRKQLDPRGEVWQRVLGATGQPEHMSGSVAGPSEPDTDDPRPGVPEP